MTGRRCARLARTRSRAWMACRRPEVPRWHFGKFPAICRVFQRCHRGALKNARFCRGSFYPAAGKNPKSLGKAGRLRRQRSAHPRLGARGAAWVREAGRRTAPDREAPGGRPPTWGILRSSSEKSEIIRERPAWARVLARRTQRAFGRVSVRHGGRHRGHEGSDRRVRSLQPWAVTTLIVATGNGRENLTFWPSGRPQAVEQEKSTCEKVLKSNYLQFAFKIGLAPLN